MTPLLLFCMGAQFSQFSQFSPFSQFSRFYILLGASLPFSHAKAERQNLTTRARVQAAVWRSCVLFALGVVLSNFAVSDERVRVMGTLQRFGVAYLLLWLLTALTPKRHKDIAPTDFEAFADVTHHVFEFLAIVAVVFLHSSLTFLLSVPSCGIGYLVRGEYAASLS